MIDLSFKQLRTDRRRAAPTGQVAESMEEEETRRFAETIREEVSAVSQAKGFLHRTGKKIPQKRDSGTLPQSSLFEAFTVSNFL